MRKKTKGQFGGLLAEFVIAAFIVLFVIIFITSFKIHVTQAMIDYYFWGKEYNIPLALLSTDIDIKDENRFESSIVIFNKIRYFKDEGLKENLRNNLRNVIEAWFPGVSQSDYTREYTLKFGEKKEEVIEKTRDCTCTWPSATEGLKCTSGCGPKAGESCRNQAECVPKNEMVTEVNNLGIYPLPVVYNGTLRVVELNWTSDVIRWIK